MSVYGFDPPQAAEVVRLVDWQLVKLTDGNHIVGTDPIYGDGRCSTRVVSWDEEKKTAVTASGRVYQLSGKQATSLGANAQYVLNVFKMRSGLEEVN